MKIGDREIGSNGDVYVIAEIGVNHDGSLERALSLVDACAEAGADAVKFQSFRSDRLMSAACELAKYQEGAGEGDPRAMLERLALSADDLRACVGRARNLGVHAIVTPFTAGDLADMSALGWDAYKTASPDIINRPLLDAIAGTGAPMIVSTGAASLGEIERAIGWLSGAHGRLCFLQCVSAYPADAEHACLAGIADIARRARCPVGYSDHTPAVVTGAVAVGAGASVLEKHVTHDRAAAGPDHGASLLPDELAEYARLARLAAAMMGVGKHVQEAERDVRRVSRQSVVAARDIAPGDTITRDDLLIKRPGTGIEPWMIGAVAGRIASRAIRADHPITDGDLS